MERYCAHCGIDDPAINGFIEHVWTVAQVRPETWDAFEDGFFDERRVGPDAESVPDDVLRRAVPPRSRQDLRRLVEQVFETSAATWYGSNLPGTAKALREVLRIVRRAGVEPPDPGPFAAHAPGLNGWGVGLSDAELAAWRAAAREA